MVQLVLNGVTGENGPTVRLGTTKEICPTGWKEPICLNRQTTCIVVPVKIRLSR